MSVPHVTERRQPGRSSPGPAPTSSLGEQQKRPAPRGGGRRPHSRIRADDYRDLSPPSVQGDSALLNGVCAGLINANHMPWSRSTRQVTPCHPSPVCPAPSTPGKRAERARQNLWASDALRRRGATFLPQLAESDPWVSSDDLEAFGAGVRNLLADSDGLRADLDRGPDFLLPHYRSLPWPIRGLSRTRRTERAQNRSWRVAGHWPMSMDVQRVDRLDVRLLGGRDWRLAWDRTDARSTNRARSKSADQVGGGPNSSLPILSITASMVDGALPSSRLLTNRNASLRSCIARCAMSRMPSRALSLGS